MTAVLSCLLVALAAQTNEGWRDIIPTPKQTQVVGSGWALPPGAAIVTDGFPRAALAAEEINLRITELGGTPLRVAGSAPTNASLLIRVTCPPRHPRQLSQWPGDRVEVTADSPGEQGYVIQFAERDGRREILLAGSDETGALHAAVTFRWLLEKSGDGISISRVAIRDWPDFKWRGAPSISFVAKTAESSSSESKAARVKRFVDWCLRRKINVLRDYALYKAGKLPRGPVEWIVEANRYAQARGFLTYQFNMSNISYGAADPQNPLHKNCAMVNPKKLFTWADDNALKVRTENLAKLCANNGFNLLGLHPPDGGGVMDPSQFSKRSAFDRQRWSDEQRAEADAHVFGTFYRAAKKLQPDMRVGFCLYPYSPIYLDYEHMKARYPDLTPELYRRNVTDYYTKIEKLLPPDAYLVVREAYRRHLDQYRAYFGSRPIITWCDFASRWHLQPYFAGVFRYIGTSYCGNDRDIMACMHTRVRPNLVNYACSAEFMWNTKSSGAAQYEEAENRYEYYRRPTEPRVLFEEFAPRACRNIWGPQAGPLMAPIFQHGLSAAAVVRTSAMFGELNKKLGLDPENYPRITSQMMTKQAVAAQKALPGLDRLIREKPAMGFDEWRTVVYYYRRVRLLHVIAQLRCHTLRGGELADEDQDAEAMAEVAAAKALYDREIPRLRTMVAETARLPRLVAKFKMKNRDAYNVLIRYDADFQSLRRALAALERRIIDKGKTLEPISHTGEISVGVYHGAGDRGASIGHQGVLMTFDGKQGMKAELITDLSLGNLVNYDCVVYPQGRLGQSSSRYDFFTGLRRYVVEAGGAVWFMHNSVGTARSEFGLETTFREVARGARERRDANTVRVVRHPITRGLGRDATIEHTYYDHWIIRRRKDAGRSVLMGEGGAVWVAGQVGKGRVLYDGTILLEAGSNQPMAATGDHEKLMVAALRWLTQREK